MKRKMRDLAGVLKMFNTLVTLVQAVVNKSKKLSSFAVYNGAP